MTGLGAANFGTPDVGVDGSSFSDGYSLFLIGVPKFGIPKLPETVPKFCTLVSKFGEPKFGTPGFAVAG